MKNLLIVVLLAVVAWLLWGQVITPEKAKDAETAMEATVAAAPSPAEPEPTPVALPNPPVVRSSELVVVRGTVIDAADGVMLVDCQPDPEPPHLSFTSANVSGGDSQALAKWAISIRDKEIMETFGALQMVSNGTLRPANQKPDDRLLGRFVIYGYPENTRRVHVVAAPTGTEYDGFPLYSVTFQLGASAAAVATPGFYPPGVDTPEQRRAYLEAHAAARKKRESGR